MNDDLFTAQEISEIFVNTPLEEDYNFLQADLVKLANAFINAAKPKIAKEERILCVDVARSLNSLVADKMAEIRGGV
jgi:hypothetical protein